MTQRKQFEQWYACNAFNYERDPIGSRDCGLQWAAWQAAQPQAAAKPVAWMDADGNFSDNNDYGTFNTPLYTSPPAHLHNGHDAKHWNLLAVQRYQENCAQQEAMRLALTTMKDLRGVACTPDEITLAPYFDAAIAALEAEVNRV